MFHKQALPDICKQIKIEGAVGLQMETKEMCLLCFFLIPLLCSLSGNSLEAPLGDLPTPFSAHRDTEKRMACTHTHTHTHTHTQRHLQREKEMWCCSTGEDIKLVMHFIISLLLWPSSLCYQPSTHNFALLILLCDTASKPAWSCRTNSYSEGTALRTQSTEYVSIMHYTSKIFKLFVRVKSWSHAVSLRGGQLGYECVCVSVL